MYDIYPELSTWLDKRIETHDTRKSSSPHILDIIMKISFGRRSGHTSAIIRYMIERFDQQPPIIFVRPSHIRMDNDMGMYDRNCNIKHIRQNMCLLAELSRTISMQLFPPSIIIFEGFNNAPEDDFGYNLGVSLSGIQYDGPLVLIG